MELFWYDIREMDEGAYRGALTMMEAARRQRITDFPAEDDRRRSAAGELLARRAVAAVLGTSPQAAPLSWDEGGKIQVAASDVYVSVSHSGAFVVCVLDTRPVGVDVEVMRGTTEKFMSRGCSQEEMAYIRYGDAGCFERFWECWTAKEALFKLTGHGPLLALSRLHPAPGVVLDYTVQNGCAVTTALQL